LETGWLAVLAQVDGTYDTHVSIPDEGAVATRAPDFCGDSRLTVSKGFDRQLSRAEG
jgi:hypothetical protein